MSRTRSRRPDLAAPTVAPSAPLVSESTVQSALVPPQSARAPVSLPRTAGIVAAAGSVLAVAGAVVEWEGWQIVWRQGDGPRPQDPAWLGAFAMGTIHNVAGALGVGGACALVTLAVTLAVPRWRASARRASLRALFIGAVFFLGILGALTQWAP